MDVKAKVLFWLCVGLYSITVWVMGYGAHAGFHNLVDTGTITITVDTETCQLLEVI